jgi:hypothetical protein
VGNDGVRGIDVLGLDPNDLENEYGYFLIKEVDDAPNGVSSKDNRDGSNLGFEVEFVISDKCLDGEYIEIVQLRKRNGVGAVPWEFDSPYKAKSGGAPPIYLKPENKRTYGGKHNVNKNNPSYVDAPFNPNIGLQTWQFIVCAVYINKDAGIYSILGCTDRFPWTESENDSNNGKAGFVDQDWGKANWPVKGWERKKELEGGNVLEVWKAPIKDKTFPDARQVWDQLL